MTAFQAFAEKIPIGDGWLIGCLDDRNVELLFQQVNRAKIGFGFNDCPDSFTGVYWQIIDYQWEKNQARFKLAVDGEINPQQFIIKIPGKFNVLNAVASIIVADFFMVDMQQISLALADFSGAAKRFDRVGEIDGVLLIDDYGHHPTEIKNSIAAVNDYYPDRPLWVLFWPHQYNRTAQFFNDFIHAFRNVDHLVVLDIYEARKDGLDKQKVNSLVLVEAMVKAGLPAEYIADFAQAVNEIKKKIRPGSVLLIQGAGPTDKIIEKYLNKKSKKK
jgi:UDP-N-acetylmuramate--alanine ligase